MVKQLRFILSHRHNRNFWSSSTSPVFMQFAQKEFAKESGMEYTAAGGVSARLSVARREPLSTSCRMQAAARESERQ
jgi:hypothetical protein